MSERKLASVEKISEIRPIEGADKIQVAMLEGLGWECVVKKDEFRVGDYVCYIQIDSKVPERPEFEFLRDRGFKVKTIKLKKQCSQGLVIPISILPKGTKIEQGMDITDILGIANYQKDVENAEEASLNELKHRSKLVQYLMGYKVVRKIYFILNPKQRKESWPSWISRSDEDRIQLVVKDLMNNFDKDWYISEKLDGSSFTAFLHKTKKWGFSKWEFGVCSRNIHLKTPTESNWWKVAKHYDLEKKLRKLDTEIVIQGECLSTNIQKNKYKVTEPDLYVFTIVENGKRVSLDRMKELCNILELKMVPIINERFNPLDTFGNITDVPTIVQKMVAMSTNKSKLADIQREGIVCRLDENPSISFKTINPEFLLKYNE